MEDRYAPSKMDIKKINESLSKNQMGKILYECNLLRTTPQALTLIAPFLFNEGITAANTTITNPPMETKITEQEQEITDEDEIHYYNPYGDEFCD